MKVLTLFNDYRSRDNGEWRVVTSTGRLLEARGVRTVSVLRSSVGLEDSLPGRVRAFLGGPYNHAAYREVAALIRAERPDVAHAHNLYPLLSPSVLVACRRAGVPTVLSVHNYSFSCPDWHHYRRGETCERCVGGREHWCVLKNCRGSLLESLGYALRVGLARRLGLFRDNVDVVVALTDFARRRLETAGYERRRIVVLPNPVEPAEATDPGAGGYVAFAGRLSPEKGLGTLMEAARRLPEVRFRVAGDGPLASDLSGVAPGNVDLTGALDRAGIDELYRGARCLVVPSEWFEMCPMVILEAMARGLPVVASRIGGLPELVEDGVTGLLFTPGDAADLARQVVRLHADPGLSRDLGASGRARARRDHSPDRYFESLVDVYARARRLAAERRDPAVAHPDRSRPSISARRRS